MRRFLIFPALFGVFGLLLQGGWEILSRLSTWWTLRFANADVYLPAPSPTTRFLSGFLVGISCGFVFAIADFLVNRHKDPSGSHALSHLLRNLKRSGLVALVPFGFCHMLPMLLLSYGQARQRYHAVSPQPSWLEVFGYAGPVIATIALLWALGTTLRRAAE